MSCGGVLSPVMTIAGAGLLQNTGLGINSALTSNLGNFNSLGITSQFSDIVSSATGVLDAGALQSLRTLGADIMPALTNAIPSEAASVLGSVANGGLTGLINTAAGDIMGSGDLTKFGQIFTAAQGYIGEANSLLNSALNVDALGATFSQITGGMDNLITGSVNQVTQAFSAFGDDLSKLGSTISLGNLANLGDPVSLLKNVTSLAGGEIPGVSQVLGTVGVPVTALTSLATDVADFGASVQKAAYQGMTQVTGSAFDQVKSVLGVTTAGLNNMADLLNPSKILPNSFPTLTMPTPDGLKGIYNLAGSVNTNLEKYLQDPNAPAYTGDDPIVRARLGLPPIDSGTVTA